MDDDKTMKTQAEAGADETQAEPVVVRPLADGADETEDVKPKETPADAGKEQPVADADSDETADSKDGDETEEERSFKKAVAEQAREDERPHSSNFTLRKIIGGDILTNQMIRNNIWLIVLIVGIMVVYITNRYKVQKDLLEIDKLKQELEDAKYRALSSSSNLTERCRESHVLETLKQGPDSDLRQSDRPPFIIEVPENEK